MTTATLFIDRDGTLIEEPPDSQVDSIRKVRFMPGVFSALQDEIEGLALDELSGQRLE